MTGKRSRHPSASRRETRLPAKEFIRADDLVRDAFRLARLIFDSGYRPEVIVVVWRGGTPVGVAVHEFLLYKGIRAHHAVVKAESYLGVGKRKTPRIEGLEGILENIAPGSEVLVVDDIFDTGLTIARLRDMLKGRTRNVKIATLYCKPANNRTGLVPDFFLRKTDRWVVFPHELMDLTPDEIRRKDPDLPAILGVS